MPIPELTALSAQIAILNELHDLRMSCAELEDRNRNLYQQMDLQRHTLASPKAMLEQRIAHLENGMGAIAKRFDQLAQNILAQKGDRRTAKQVKAGISVEMLQLVEAIKRDLKTQYIQDRLTDPRTDNT